MAHRPAPRFNPDAPVTEAVAAEIERSAAASGYRDAALVRMLGAYGYDHAGAVTQKDATRMLAIARDRVQARAWNREAAAWDLEVDAVAVGLFGPTALVPAPKGSPRSMMRNPAAAQRTDAEIEAERVGYAVGYGADERLRRAAARGERLGRLDARTARRLTPVSRRTLGLPMPGDDSPARFDTDRHGSTPDSTSK